MKRRAASPGRWASSCPHGSAGGGSDGNFTGAMGIPTLDGLGVRGADAHTLQRTYRGRQPGRARPADGGTAGDAGVRESNRHAGATAGASIRGMTPDYVFAASGYDSVDRIPASRKRRP